MKRRKIIIAQTGDPVPRVAEARGPFAHMIRDRIGGAWEGDFVTFDARTEAPPDPRGADGFILTGSAANVPNREPWMLAMEAWLRDVVQAGTPTFGICFGHQILAHALGGSAEKNPEGREIGTILVHRLDEDPIFDGIPETFAAHATHIDTAAKLPEGAVALARSSRDNHQVIRFTETCYGVQFHPEFDAGVMVGYLETRRDILVGEGFHYDGLVASVTETALASRTLTNFVRHVVPRGATAR